MLQAVFENSLDAILLADDDAGYVDANPAACALTGYTREELLRLSVWELTPETSQEEGLATWREFVAAGNLSGEYTIERKDGTALDVEFRAVANIVPGLHMSVLRDVGERKRRDEALRESNERLRTIIEASPAALVVLTLEGEITLWSPAAERIFGWREEEVVGQSYPLAGPPELAAELAGEGGGEPHERLSDREYQVMLLLAEGKTVGDIAGELSLSVKTISTYRARILEKLGLASTAEIIRYAFRHGLAE